MFLQLKKFCNCVLLSPELGIKFGDLVTFISTERVV